VPAHARLAVLVAAGVLAAAPAAQAAPWKQLTAANGSNIDQVSLLRTPDGVLHVAWQHPTGPLTGDLMHTAISAKGAIGPTSPIASGWTGFENPGLVAAPGGGLRVFFGAIRSITPGDPDDDLETAASGDGGRSWALTEGSIVPKGGQAYGSPVSATTLADGTPLQAWAGTLGTWVHAGLTPATPIQDYQAPLGHYGYDPGIAASGQGAMLAWYSNATGHLGVHAQAVGPDGAPAGPLMAMPSTDDMNVGMIGRTPIAARPGGGYFVAYATGYPSLNRVRVWRVGAGGAPALAKTGRDSTATIAAAPDGRLWAAWMDVRGSRLHVLARRSNPQATRFGAIVDAGAPKKTGSVYRLDASAAPGGGADLFAAVSRGVQSTVATWHRRILPGLTLTASKSAVPKGRAANVTFRVTDAGRPVKGATVRAGGAGGRTNGQGRITLKIKGGTVARATDGGYAPATVRVKGRR
jgi:hypothetical protein